MLCSMWYAKKDKLDRNQLSYSKNLCIIRVMHYQLMHYRHFNCNEFIRHEANLETPKKIGIQSGRLDLELVVKECDARVGAVNSTWFMGVP